MENSKGQANGIAWSLDSGKVGVGFMEDEKRFLDGVFRRYPGIGEAFRECADIFPTNRQHAVRMKMTQTERRVWEDCGIPEGHRETLAEHVGRMMMLANAYPQAKYDYAHTIEKISVWAMPRTIAGEIPFDEMPPQERFRLYNSAARLVCCDHSERGRLALWQDLETPVAQRKPFNRDTDESDWVSTLDYIATAQRARQEQRIYFNRHDTLEKLVESCRTGISTKEGYEIWHKAVGPAPDARPIELVMRGEQQAPTAPMTPELVLTGRNSVDMIVHAPS